jgi:predicted metal-dependent peptidase
MSTTALDKSKIKNVNVEEIKITPEMEEKLEKIIEEIKSGNSLKILKETILKMISAEGLMLEDSDSLKWYGHLITDCELKVNTSLPAPAGVRFNKYKYELHINPLLFNLYDLKGRIAILKHEMLHILSLHMARQNEREHLKWNIATDIAINQLIPNIPEDGLRPELFDLEKDKSAEWYYDALPEDVVDQFRNNSCQNNQNQNQNEQSDSNGSQNGNQDGQNEQNMNEDGEGDSEQNTNDGNGGQEEGDNENSSKNGSQQTGNNGYGDFGDKTNSNSSGDQIIDNEEKLRDLIRQALSNRQQGFVDSHDLWNESEGDKNSMKQIAEQMSNSATNKTRGHIPTEAMGLIQALKSKEQVNWKKVLRKIVGNKKANVRLTIKRRDRRFPKREDLRGKTKDRQASLLVVIDTSGSISNGFISTVLNEIRAISKINTHIDIIEVDTEARYVDDFDIKKLEFKRTKMGGTYLFPAIKLADEMKLKYNAIVMVTDGYIENDDEWEYIPKKPIIWLVEDDVENLAFNWQKYSNMRAFSVKNKAEEEV